MAQESYHRYYHSWIQLMECIFMAHFQSPQLKLKHRELKNKKLSSNDYPDTNDLFISIHVCTKRH